MPEIQILDPEAIESLKALSPDADETFLRELIEIYLQDTPERLAEIEQALGQGDPVTMMRAAHSIKGSSSNFGATHFAHLAHEIELLGKAANCEDAVPLLPGLKTEYGRVTQALSQLLGGA